MRGLGRCAVVLIGSLLAGCSWWVDKPPTSAEQTGAPTQSKEAQALTSTPGAQPVQVRFALYRGPLGFRLPDTARLINPGDRVVIGTEPVDLDILLPGLTEQVGRQSIRVEGVQISGQPVWLREGGLALQLGAGEAGRQVTVTVTVPAQAPAVLTLVRAERATVTVDQRYGDSWRALTMLSAYTPPGPGEVRLLFSKAVRQHEVESALTDAQPSPVRGRFYWEDDTTLIWMIAQLPPRLDFLLDGAHDQDGLPLPGGIPSLRTGDPPRLVEVQLSDRVDVAGAVVPPDIISAELSHDRSAVNFVVWSAGTNRWDWRTTDFYLHLETQSVRPGRVEGTQPRLPSDLENWVARPDGILVAGLRLRGSGSGTAETAQVDLVLTDLRGGRQEVVSAFLTRHQPAYASDRISHLAWTSLGSSLAALTMGQTRETSDLILYDVAQRERRVLARGLPVPAHGTRLAWSTDGRFLAVGNLILDQTGRVVLALPGVAGSARGVWERNRNRLLYNEQDWGPIFVVSPESQEVLPLGAGMVVDWTGPDRAALIRWNGSESRYRPTGLGN